MPFNASLAQADRTTPCTPSTYIMARLFGGEYRVVAGIISSQTAIAAVTIPAICVSRETIYPFACSSDGQTIKL